MKKLTVTNGVSIFQKYLILLVLYIGYTTHTYSRRSFQNVINYVLKEQLIDQEQIGLIVTSQQIGYTFSKVLHPIIIDRINPTLFFTLGLFFPGIFMIIFSHTNSLHLMVLLYSSQGFMLAYLWPALAKILKMIIGQHEFGMWWSIECTSSNIGAIIGSVISTVISEQYGWRMSIKVSAATCITSSLLSFACFKIFKFNDISLNQSRSQETDSVSEGETKLKRIDYILNPVLICNGILFASVYLSRYVISDWYQIYLKELEFEQMTIASFISSMEFGGTVGSIVAGISADFCLIRFPNTKNPRLIILIICGVFISILEYMLTFCVVANMDQFTLMLLGFGFGFFLYGPVSIGGIIAIEAAPLDRQGLCYSINVLYANLAMIIAGFPTSYVAANFGWKVVLIICLITMIISTLLIILIRNYDTPIDKLLNDKPKSLTLNHSTTEWCIINEEESKA